MVVILAVMSLVILSVILLTPGKKELLKWKQQSHRGEELQCGELKERCEFFGGNVGSGGEFAEKINRAQQ